jgi:hypothetical protein
MSAIDISYFEAGYIDETYFTRIVEVECAMTATFTQTVVTVSRVDVELFAFNNAQLAAEVTRIRSNNIAVSSVFTVVANAAKSVYVLSQEDAAFALAVNNNRVRTTLAAVNAAFSSEGIGSIIVAPVRAVPRTTITIIGDLNG